MADIHIQREHKLGLAKARELALRWAEQAEQTFDMECTVLEGVTSDTVEFSRGGVNGELLVEANRFTLEAKLGFLMGAFAKTIESEIEKNFDELLKECTPTPRAKSVAKKAAGKGAQ